LDELNAVKQEQMNKNYQMVQRVRNMEKEFKQKQKEKLVCWDLLNGFLRINLGRSKDKCKKRI